MPTARSLLFEFAMMLAIGVVLAALGPFGSYAIDGFANRLAYWVPMSFAGYAIYRPATSLARKLGEWLDIADGWAVAIMALVAAVPATLVVVSFGPSRRAVQSFDDFFGVYLNVALLGGLITFMFYFLERSAAAQPAPALPAPAESPFLRRLSPGFARPVAALEMEDHYVRAHGADGRSELVLMRMRDAVAELDGANGLRVHRSWWVAREAVVGKRREGRALVLLLAGGLEAPVSRDRVADLRTAGWL